MEGPHTLFGSRAGDWAMGFNGSSSQAYTESSVFGESESFVVAAHVNPETVSSRRAVITQDSVSTVGWSVGDRRLGMSLRDELVLGVLGIRPRRKDDQDGGLISAAVGEPVDTADSGVRQDAWPDAPVGVRDRYA